MVAAVGTLTAAITASVKATAEYGDNIDKMSQKMGLSAEAYQEWDFVMQHSGASIESLQAGMKTLASAAETNSAAFQKLGITQEQIASMSQEELFGETIKALQGVEDETQRTYLAGQLLGRGATELGALLNTSAEETEAMKKQAHDLGGVMSDDAVKAAAAFQDSLQNLQTAFGGLKRGLAGEFLPAITAVMDGLSLIFSGGDGGLEKVNQGVTDFVSNLSSKIPQLFSVGTSIIKGLLSAIMQNLPMLTKAAFDTIKTLAEGIIGNLPLIVESAVEIIMQLADGIAESLPTLIPTVIEVLLQVVQSLIDNAPMMIQAAISLIMQLAQGLINALPTIIAALPQIVQSIVSGLTSMAPQLVVAAIQLIIQLAAGLIQAIPQLVEALPEIISAIVNGLVDGMGSIIEVGKNIVQGIWKGISGAADWLWGKITGWLGGVVDGIASFLGIHSPSTVMRDRIGKFLAQGIGVGFEDEMPNVEKQMTDALQFETMKASVAFDGQSGRGVNELLAEIIDKLDRPIVLDDGTLVGKIAPKVDTALGQRAVYSGRYVLGGA